MFSRCPRALLGALCLAGLLGAELWADDPPTTFQPEFGACKAPLSSEEENRLRKEQRTLEASSAQLSSKLQGLKTSAVAPRESTEADLRSVQASLLRVLERLECKRLSTLSDEILRGPAAPKVNFVEMRVRYATDRRKEPGIEDGRRKDPLHYFSGQLDADFADFSFGSVLVTIPTQRQPGELNLPSSWHFVGQPDPSRYFVLREITENGRQAFFNDLNDASGPDSLLLFVHGFNVPFADAALRAAQLAHDLQFPGKVMLYSWPSVGAVDGYWQDEDTSRISTPRFQRLLADLLKTKQKRIFVVAHSMGTRIVIPAVSALTAQGVDLSKVSELMIAAADFNAIEFKQLASGFAGLRAKGTRTTIYSASNDFALLASRKVHSYRRLGESNAPMQIYAGLDSVDASAAAPTRRAYGHSYVSDSPQVLGDMQDLVLKGLEPKNRGLEAIANSSNYGWRIPQKK